MNNEEAFGCREEATRALPDSSIESRCKIISSSDVRNMQRYTKGARRFIQSLHLQRSNWVCKL